jgi:acetyltransferase-like isoleucine patch superfamily enzyme
MGIGSILSAENGELRLGDQVHFGAYNYIAASDSYIHVGTRLLCSPFVSLIALNHQVIDGVVSWTEHDTTKQGIEIGDDCWLATNSVILPGVALGDRCVVAAGSVVTKSFPADTKLGGVPARRIE